MDIDPEETFTLYEQLNATCVLDELVQDADLNPHWKLLYRRNLFETVSSVVILVLGIFFNFRVVLPIALKRLYTRPTFLLLLNLAIADLLVCLVSINFDVIVGFSGQYSFGNTDYVRCQVCKIAAAFVMLKLLSSFNIALLSADRFVFIRSPLDYREIFTVNVVVFTLISTWILSLAFAIPPLFGYGDVVFFVPCGFVFLTPAHVARGIPFMITVGVCMSVVVAFLAVSNAVMVVKIIQMARNLKRTVVTNITPVQPEAEDSGSGFGATATQASYPSPSPSPGARGGERPGGTPAAETGSDRQTDSRNMVTARKEIRLYLVLWAIILGDIAMSLPAAVAGFIGVVFGYDNYQFISTALVAVLFQTVLHPVIATALLPELGRGVQYYLYRAFSTTNSRARASEASANYYPKLMWFHWEDLWVAALQKELEKGSPQL